MVNKYARLLEEREYNTRTDTTWAIDDVPNTWKNRVMSKIEADGYYVGEDGTVYKNEA